MNHRWGILFLCLSLFSGTLFAQDATSEATGESDVVISATVEAEPVTLEPTLPATLTPTLELTWTPLDTSIPELTSSWTPTPTFTPEPPLPTSSAEITPAATTEISLPDATTTSEFQTFGFTQTFDQEKPFEGFATTAPLTLHAGRIGQGVRFTADDGLVSVQRGYLFNIDLTADVFLEAGTAWLYAHHRGVIGYKLSFDASTGLTLWENEASLVTVPFPAQTWVTLRWTTNDTQIQVWLDGVLVITSEVTNPAPSGLVALRTAQLGKGALLIDNVTLTAEAGLPTEEPAEEAPAMRSMQTMSLATDDGLARFAFVTINDASGQSKLQVETVGVSDRHTVFQNGSDLLSAQWSPDGQSIAFISNRYGNKDLYVVNSLGQGLQKLTNSTSPVVSYCWIPDGTGLFYVSGYQLWRMAAAGGPGVLQSSLLDYDIYEVSCSRQMTYTKLILTADYSDSMIYISSYVWDWIGQGAPNLIGNNMYDLVLSPKIGFSNLLAFTTNGNVYRNITGGGAPQLIVSIATEPVWSPNGERILVHKINRWEIYDARQVNAFVGIRLIAPAGEYDNYPSWRAGWTVTPPLPTPRVVTPKAANFHLHAEQFGLPLPFDTWPIQADTVTPLRQGYGPTGYGFSLTNNGSLGVYKKVHNIHPGIDFSGGKANKTVISICSGLVVGGKTTTAPGDYGISIMCFLDDNIDPDGDGIRNLSNIIVVYNHLNQQKYTNRSIVMEGDELGKTMASGTNVDHLHLEVFLAYGQSGESIRINPLFMFHNNLVTRFNNNSPQQPNPCQKDPALMPYFPIARYAAVTWKGDDCRIKYVYVTTDAQNKYASYESAFLEDSFSLYGLAAGDLNSLSQEGNLRDSLTPGDGTVLGIGNFETFQIPAPPSTVEWWSDNGMPRLINDISAFLTQYTIFGTQAFKSPNCGELSITLSAEEMRTKICPIPEALGANPFDFSTPQSGV